MLAPIRGGWGWLDVTPAIAGPAKRCRPVSVVYMCAGVSAGVMAWTHAYHPFSESFGITSTLCIGGFVRVQGANDDGGELCGTVIVAVSDTIACSSTTYLRQGPSWQRCCSPVTTTVTSHHDNAIIHHDHRLNRDKAACTTRRPLCKTVESNNLHSPTPPTHTWEASATLPTTRIPSLCSDVHQSTNPLLRAVLFYCSMMLYLAKKGSTRDHSGRKANAKNKC